MAHGILARRVADLTRILLDPGRDASTLRPEVVDLAACLVEVSGHVADARIDAGESRTSEGLALSPSMAAMCIDDYVRTIVFLRGVHAAIAAHADDAPVRVQYVGCGPLATLLAPLLPVIDPGQWTCRWIDVHEPSVRGARRVAEALDPGGVVESVDVADAATLHFDASWRPDVVVMEILQAVLEHEPQVALTRHLMAQVPDATLVPERITVAMEWMDLGRLVQGEADPARADLGDAFVLDRTIVARPSFDGRFEGATLTLPDPLPSSGQPMLCTRIDVFGGHTLRDLDSGLTVPRPLPLDGPLRPGAAVRFRYRTGADPALEASTVD